MSPTDVLQSGPTNWARYCRYLRLLLETISNCASCTVVAVHPTQLLLKRKLGRVGAYLIKMNSARKTNHKTGDTQIQHWYDTVIFLKNSSEHYVCTLQTKSYFIFIDPCLFLSFFSFLNILLSFCDQPCTLCEWLTLVSLFCPHFKKIKQHCNGHFIVTCLLCIHFLLPFFRIHAIYYAVTGK